VGGTITDERPVAAGRPGQDVIEGSSQRSRDWLYRGLGVAFVVVVLAAWWGFSGRVSLDGAAIGDVLTVPGGEMRVDAVRPEIMVHSMRGMPASLMPDALPEGFRRFSVDVSLLAGRGEVLEYGPDRFRIGGTEIEDIAPHRVTFADADLPGGEMMTVSMLFEAPLDVEVVWLTFEGASDKVILEGDLGDGHGDHGEGLGSPNIVVSIDDFAYENQHLSVPAGSVVGWVNNDVGIPHTVTFVTDGPDSGVMQPGSEFAVALDASASLSYFCSIHPYMTGTITVTDS